MSQIKRLHGPFKQGNITMGENSYCQSDTYMIYTPNHHITIGDNCAIGHWCYLSTKMHKTDNHKERFEGDITIGNNCWLGNGVIVYPGVTIGDNCVIGAHVVVTKDIPAGSLVRNYYQIKRDFRHKMWENSK